MIYRVIISDEIGLELKSVKLQFEAAKSLYCRMIDRRIEEMHGTQGMSWQGVITINGGNTGFYCTMQPTGE